MKKMIACVSAITLFFTGIAKSLTDTIFAAEYDIIDTEIPIFQETAVEDSALKQLAVSHGLGTDTFSFPNHIYDTTTDRAEVVLENYTKNLTATERFMYYEYKFENLTNSGCCFGIAALTVLVHNGILSPSDIYADAKTLYDIPLTEDVDDLIAAYSLVQAHKPVQYSAGLNSTYSDAKKMEQLLDCAKRCQETGEYFLISFQDESISHAVTGLGMTTGNWEWDGVSYDTCILTYDSNCVSAEENHIPFRDEQCIYINSETKQFYIPIYELGSETGASFTLVTNNADLLLYKAPYSETTLDATNTSNIVQCRLFHGNAEGLKISIDGSEAGEYDFSNAVYYLEGDAFHIEQELSEPERVDLRISGDTYISRYDAFDAEKYTADMSSQSASLTNKGEQQFTSTLYLAYDTETCDYSPTNWFDYIGVLSPEQTLTLSKQERGVLISGNSPISGDAQYIFDCSYAEETTGNSIKGTSFRIYTEESEVLVTYDTEEEHENFYLDLDKDGIYDNLIEIGDANGNGISYEADDAYQILLSYASQSVRKSQLVNTYLCDINKNNQIDPDDAYEVLVRYAENSVRK